MTKRTDMKKTLVIGSGPIVIGQAAEFDYAGGQARQFLREEGYKVVLINSNPATVMADTTIADRVYIEPLTLEFVNRIIYKERPDAILDSLEGQTGLNLVIELAESGILEEYDVEILGVGLAVISKAEDHELFRNLMHEINKPVPGSDVVHTVEETIALVNSIGYPVVVHPAYTLGGTGGGFTDTGEGLRTIADSGLKLPPVRRRLIERSVAGFKEIGYEVIRDNNDNAIMVCNMENIDPVGIHTGDFMVVALVQTLSGRERQMLRNASLRIIHALKICGDCNIQLALDPSNFKYYIIGMNPKVSRSSALASRATGYPIAELAVEIAVGMILDGIINPITKASYAYFEPSLDYIVTKLARLPLDKSERAGRRLRTQMKAAGKVMSVGRSSEESFLKTVRSLEMKCDHIDHREIDTCTTERLQEKITVKDDLCMFGIAKPIRRRESLARVHETTKIDMFFLHRFANIISPEEEMMAHPQDLTVLRMLKENGFAGSYITRRWGMKERSLYELRKNNSIVSIYKVVDTRAAELESATPCFYSTYEQETGSFRTDREKTVVLGSGPTRIGQGVEFDYVTVHCIMTLREHGYKVIIINSDPETVSTGFSISGKLYFEPLTIEDVIHVVGLEQPLGVIAQLGGQTTINLADKLVEHGVKILGASLRDIGHTGDRHAFEAMLHTLGIPQPQGETAMEVEEAVNIANRVRYPVLVCPFYVLDRHAVGIMYSNNDLRVYMVTAVKGINHDAPILVDKYITGKGLEVDAICDGEHACIPGIMERTERAGIHSGDSINVYPPQTISGKVRDTIVDYSIRIGKGFHFIGLFNIQFIVEAPKDGKEGMVYALGINPRSSRTVPFLSKITGVIMSHITTRCVLGDSLTEQGYEEGIRPLESRVFVKAPVFPSAKLRNVSTVLGPEVKSTGEALGGDVTLEKALYKALLASGIRIPNHGDALVTIAGDDKEGGLRMAERFSAIGYGAYTTSGTARFLQKNGLFMKTVNKIPQGGDLNVLDVIHKGKVNYVINTMSSEDKEVTNDDFPIHRVSAENNINCFTSFDTADAILKVLETLDFTTISINELEH